MKALNEHIDKVKFYSIHPKSANLSISKKSNLKSDEEVWGAFKNGDEWAYEYMFKEYYNLLLNYGLKINRNEDDVKDFIQQLFTRLWESKERLGKNNSIKSYLLSSLRRMILRGTKSKLTLLDIWGASVPFHVDLTTENRFIKDQNEREQINYLARLIEKLPKRQKEAVYLKYYGEHAINEISEIMEISAGVAYKLIYKALKNLNSKIDKSNNLAEIFDR